MKRIHYAFSLFCSLILLLSANRSSAQIVLSYDSVSCGGTTTTLHAAVTGSIPTGAGITADDGYSGLIPIGFSYNFYGTTYSQVCIGANGLLSFDPSVAGMYCPWPISAALLGNPSARNCIAGPWCDIFLPGGGTITYTTVGTAPYRKFVVTWCNTAMFSCTSQTTTSQIILYETTNVSEVHIGHKTVCSTWNSGRAIVGVQNATGTAATAAPGRDFPSVWTAYYEAWRFTPDASVSSYTCTSIPYASVPYASSTVSWYDSATGAYLGSGSSLSVTPSGPTTYMATAAGCGDSTRSYLHVDLSSGSGGGVGTAVHISAITSTNPTECGKCDGTVTLYGINPGEIDTVFYSFNGVPQPRIVTTAGADSIITITGLCDGTYDYFYVKVGPCFSNSVPANLVDPPFVAGFNLSIGLGCEADTLFTNNTSYPSGKTSIWNFGDGSPVDSSVANATHVYTNQGTYMVSLTYRNIYGCVSNQSYTINIYHPLVSAFATSADSVCLGVPIATVNSSVGSGASYDWNFGDGITDYNFEPTHTYAAAGVYQIRLTVNDTIGCTTSSTHRVAVHSINARTYVHDTIVCLRDSMLMSGYTEVVPSYMAGSESYQWSPLTLIGHSGSADAKFKGLGVHVYTFTATLWPLGCTSSDTIRIDSKFPLQLTHVTASQTINLGESIQLNADSADQYTWYPNDGTLDNANISNPIATPTDSTTYMVVGQTVWGCKDTAYVTVGVNQIIYSFIPTSFTPNGDGTNDYFRPVNLRQKKLVDFRVFNRWGREVFQASGNTQGWDGSYLGQPQDMGVYYYNVILAEPDGKQQVLTGDVTLIR